MKPALQTPRCNPGDTMVIEAVYHSEGRVAYTAGANPRYEYSIKDHPRDFGVGAPKSSTRLTFCDLNSDGAIQTPSEILQENHYYPFGLALNGPWMNNAAPYNLYQYNGKELQPDHGLGWYDYGARMYMPELGRWNGVDALAEKYAGWSTYNYVLGNPISFIDPDGREVWISLEGGGSVQYRNGRLYDGNGNKYKAEKGSFASSVQKSLRAIERQGGKVGRELVSRLASAPATGENGILVNIYAQTGGAAYQSGNIGFDPSLGLLNESGEVLSPAGILAHELGHGFVQLNGGLKDGNLKWFSEGGDPYYTNLEEKYVIQTFEQPIANAMGMPFNRKQHGLSGESSVVPVVGGVTSNRVSAYINVSSIASEIRQNMLDPIQTRKERYFDALRKAGIDPSSFPAPWEINKKR